MTYNEDSKDIFVTYRAKIVEEREITFLVEIDLPS